MEYRFEFDCVNGEAYEDFYECDTLYEAIIYATNELTACDGGHCDIYDDSGNFIQDVEI